MTTLEDVANGDITHDGAAKEDDILLIMNCLASSSNSGQFIAAVIYETY